MNVIPTIGDFVVLKGRFGWDAGRVTRITSLFIWRHDDRWKRDQREDKSRIKFAGPEDQARLLVERLKSSEALYEQEQRASYQRREDRNEKILSGAA